MLIQNFQAFSTFYLHQQNGLNLFKINKLKPSLQKLFKCLFVNVE